MSPVAGGRYRDTRPGLPVIFTEMADSMESLSSPMYAAICRAVAADLEAGGPSAGVLAEHADARVGEMIPLRLLAAVHRLVLERRAPGLATFYPDVGGSLPPTGRAGQQARSTMASMFLAVLREHAAEVRAGLSGVPQTNEIGRSAALVGALRLLEESWRLPVDLHELGASAGLNLRADAYRIEPVGLGPEDAALVVEGAWDPHDPFAPPVGSIRVSGRTGCDLNPIDPTTTEGRLQLTSYLWPDQPWRFERLRAALATARRVPATLVKASAQDHLRSLRRRPGRALVVWHSAMWMYPTAEQRQEILGLLSALGEEATVEAPLAHVAFEPLGADPVDPHRFLLVLTTWPGVDGRPAGVPYLVGHAPAHGVPVTWREPEPVDISDQPPG